MAARMALLIRLNYFSQALSFLILTFIIILVTVHGLSHGVWCDHARVCRVWQTGWCL